MRSRMVANAEMVVFSNWYLGHFALSRKLENQTAICYFASWTLSLSTQVRGDNLLGCAVDEDNQPDDSEDRAKKWVEQIKGEGEESRLSGFAASSDATILQKPLFSQRRPTIDIEVVSEVFFPKCDDFHMP